MRLVSIHGSDGVLSVRCSGVIGIGSEGLSSMRSVSDAIGAWLNDHRGAAVREIFMDFTDVEYRWGDAPFSCLVRFVGLGVKKFRFLADPDSARALTSLLAATNLPWFVIEQADP